MFLFHGMIRCTGNVPSVWPRTAARALGEKKAQRECGTDRVGDLGTGGLVECLRRAHSTH